MKRFTCLLAVAFLTACASESTAPTNELALSGVDTDLVQQYDATAASAVDRSGIGGSSFPDSIALSAEQKAKIQALHDAYKAANAADVEALKAIEKELKEAVRANKPRAEIEAIKAKATPILARMREAFAKLQRDLWAVYTPAQQVWLTNKGRGDNAVCRPDVLSQLTEAQVTQIRDLKTAFQQRVQTFVATIKTVHEEARAAAQAGKSRDEVKAILARAEPAMEALKKAEKELADAILGVLTPAQKANACLVRALLGR